MKFFVGENDRIKLLVLLCGEEDELLIIAASGTLAVLSTLQVDLEEIKGVELDPEDRKKFDDLIEENRIICEKIVQVHSFIEVFKHLCASLNADLQFRAFYVIRNIVQVNKELATRIVETELMEILFAIKEMKNDRLSNEKVCSYHWLLSLLDQRLHRSINFDVLF